MSFKRLIHASGHATFNELKEVVEEVAPRILIPIHTEHPEEFRELAEQVYDRIPQRPGIDFVLLSHHHADHAQYITFLMPEIPVICSLKTKLIELGKPHRL